MSNYYLIRVKFGETCFYLQTVTWYKDFEPTFQPVFVNDVETAGLFFSDQVKKILKMYPDAEILRSYKLNGKRVFIEVETVYFTR